MILPNRRRAIVEKDKLTEYLLNAEHPDNGGKATFFTWLGFNRDEWKTLADALQNLAVTAPVSQYMESVHGSKYIINGKIENPAGKAAQVRTIWIIDVGTDLPRLVTAYPFEKVRRR